MRRNITSILKFMMLCALVVVLTIFFYKTFFQIQRTNDIQDDEKHQPIASAQHHSNINHPRQGGFFMGSEKNAKKVKIDWHNYQFIEAEKRQTGIGEHGVPASVSDDEEAERKRLFDLNGFNALLSDYISVNRSVKDIRHKE